MAEPALSLALVVGFCAEVEGSGGGEVGTGSWLLDLDGVCCSAAVEVEELARLSSRWREEEEGVTGGGGGGCGAVDDSTNNESSRDES